MPPDFEEHLVDDVFGRAFVSAKAQSEPIDLHAKSTIEHTHGVAIATRDPFEESHLGGGLSHGASGEWLIQLDGQCDAVHGGSPSSINPCVPSARNMDLGGVMR